MTTPHKRQVRTPDQQAIVDQLVQRWKIEPDKILFLKPGQPLEPWLNYAALTVIARGSGRFRSLSEHFSTFVPGLNHLVHTATVIDSDGFEYTRTGVAQLGETIVKGEEVDEHSLAATRALRAALDSAGFDAVKASSIVALDLALPKDEHAAQQEDQERISDVRLIHTLARQKGLITPSDPGSGTTPMRNYRTWLSEHFGVDSAAALSAAERAIVINKLRLLPDAAEAQQPKL